MQLSRGRGTQNLSREAKRFAGVKNKVYLCTQIAALDPNRQYKLLNINRMKFNKVFSALALMVAVAFTACNENAPIVGPNGGGDGDTTKTDTTSYEVITVAQALEIANALEPKASTDKSYELRGKVTGVYTDAEKLVDYGNINFELTDATGFIGCYYINYLNNEKFTSADQILNVGDSVVLISPLKNYVKDETTTPEAANGYLKVIVKAGSTIDPADLDGDGTRANPYSATDVMALANSKTGNFWVKAYIVGQIAGKAISGAEFAAPFTPSATDVTYGTNLIVAASATETDYNKCVPVALPTGAIRNALNLPENPDMLGKEVLIYGSLEKYFSVAGIKSPSYVEVGETKIGIDPDVEQVEPEAKVATIAEFIAAPESTTDYYELTGTIGGSINATYGNFDLTDETGTVYVYGLTKAFIAVGSTTNDKSYGSLGLKAGDNITLRGFRGSYQNKIEVMGAYFVKKN